jgi:hypothetical protein
VAAAEDQGTRAIERIEFRERVRGHRRCQQRQSDQENEEQRQQRRSDRPAHVHRQGVRRDLGAAAKQRDACHAAEHDGADLAPNRRQRQCDDCRHDRERGAWTIRRERTGHAQHRLRDDRNRSDLEAMQPARACGVAERVDAVTEQDHGDRRWQREPYPGCQGAGVTRAQQPDGDADLARSRPRQELAKGDEIGVAAVVEPTPPDDELVAKIAEMRDRSAEGGEAEP